MILLIDNYDSFSYNLYQLLGMIDGQVKVVRNDSISPDDIAGMRPDHIVLSPGPGRPADSGICPEVIRRFSGKIPILGVCLGHQAIAEVFGARVSYAKKIMHGKQSRIYKTDSSVLLQNLGSPFYAARYHSLAVMSETVPPSLRITAETKNGEVMAIEHRDFSVYGVQFHPESILTPEGSVIMQNFLSISDPVHNRGR